MVFPPTSCARYPEGVQQVAGLMLIAVLVSIACALVIFRHAKSSPADAGLDSPSTPLRWFYRACLAAACYLPATAIIWVMLTGTDCCHAAFRAVFETLPYRMSQAFVVALPVPLAIVVYYFWAREVRRKTTAATTRTS